MMQYKLVIFFGFILLLFVSPLIASSFNLSQDITVEELETPKKLVYALTTTDVPLDSLEPALSKNVLMLFTHSHEAFIPIVKNKSGKTAVYDSKSNITEFEEIIKMHFNVNSLNTKFLDVDTMDELYNTNRTFSEAYDVVRPYLSNEIQNNTYDLIVDLHRDSASRDISTLTYNNQTFGKIYFVVGEDNPNYLINQSYSEQISDKLNELVPGISRGVIGKKGEHVDGIYNQDLAKNMVLIELGGIENTEEEINRTISVLAQAISKVLQDESSVETN
ncbi:stage II sporulation protein P [Ureibacillus manganicus]|uniref:Stage II sporulation protein P n=1 Tax=Ureibacillus manganicus DSM 26584 TaxID=1384049 RepID=A0A0A3IQQ3_9BACL|nr:stage II sporulation protein P [Ureibacillus manganicus]KGR77157.1 hypothetical protein CD29_15795 [Ureibacillus manganicus DSM 26584]